MAVMQCRPGCAACCTAPSISSPIPGMPGGKPAGIRCIQLDEHGLCRLFGDPARPAVCASLTPEPDMCGESREHAMLWLQRLELETRPAPVIGSALAPKAQNRHPPKKRVISRSTCEELPPAGISST